MPVHHECSPEPLERFHSPALFLGHPGHELKVFGWVAENRPIVYVLTDGSGCSGVSRLPSSAKLLTRLGARLSPVFGPFSDSEIYEAILQHNTSLFLGLVDRVAESLVTNRVDFVAGDATEWFNPSHDLARALLNAAVALAERTTGKAIANYEFCLTGWEQDRQERHGSQCYHLRLDDQLLQEKLAAATQYVEIKGEVQRALALRGEEYFRVECMKKVSPDSLRNAPEKPFYETWGEQRQAEGTYKSVVRYKQHMLPLLEAIREHAGATVIMVSLTEKEAPRDNRVAARP